MKPRMRCLSVSDKNQEAVEFIDEYSDMTGATFAGAVFAIAKDWKRLKTKERLWELQAIR